MGLGIRAAPVTTIEGRAPPTGARMVYFVPIPRAMHTGKASTLAESTATSTAVLAWRRQVALCVRGLYLVERFTDAAVCEGGASGREKYQKKKKKNSKGSNGGARES